MARKKGDKEKRITVFFRFFRHPQKNYRQTHAPLLMVSEIASAPPITYHSAPCLQLHLQSARSSCKTLRQNSIGCNERVTKTRARSDIRTDAYVSLPEGHEGQRGSHSACLPAPWMSSLVSCLRMCMCAFARPFTHTYTIHIYVYEIQYNSINRVAINIIALLRELILISANRNDNQNSKDVDKVMRLAYSLRLL